MLVKNYKKFLNLSKLLNNSFGSTGPDPLRLGTQSLKFEILDDGMLKVLFITTVSFPSETIMREARKRWETEAISMIKGALKELEEQYKENYKESINCSIIDDSFNDSFEFVSYSMYNPIKRALYRVGVFVEVED